MKPPVHAPVTGDRTRPRLDIVLPVHEEATSLERVLDELHAEFSQYVEPRFIVCEDGSRDGTRALLETLRHRLPIVLCAHLERRGYAAAVVEGIRLAETEYVLSMDADGQCDPRDLPRFLAQREDVDITIGCRVPRRDPALRRFLSFGFSALHRLLFGATVRDPSCPFVLMRRDAVTPLLGRMGRLPVGFWWELVARSKRAPLLIREVPIRHRGRFAGKSRAIRLRKLPTLALTHAVGLVRIRLERRGSG